jgi:hypothetical protein
MKMKNQNKNVLLKRNNSSLGVALSFLIICLGLFLLAILKDQLALEIIFLFFSLLCVFALVKMKTLSFCDQSIILTTYWQKKVVWNFDYEELKKVEIDYFSDTFYESKQLHFTLNNGTKFKVINCPCPFRENCKNIL